MCYNVQGKTESVAHLKKNVGLGINKKRCDNPKEQLADNPKEQLADNPKEQLADNPKEQLAI